MKLNTIFLFSIVILIFIIQIKSHKNNEIRCRKCNNKITEINEIINQKSSMSLMSSNKEILNKENVLTHTFKNPNNNFFQLITTKSAQLTCDSKAYETHTFFQGYAWSSCICSCGTHHGWMFIRIPKYCDGVHKENEMCGDLAKFFGLSLENLKSNQDRKISEEKIEF